MESADGSQLKQRLWLVSVSILDSGANGYLTFMLNLLRSYKVVCLLDGSPSVFIKVPILRPRGGSTPQGKHCRNCLVECIYTQRSEENT